MSCDVAFGVDLGSVGEVLYRANSLSYHAVHSTQDNRGKFLNAGFPGLVVDVGADGRSAVVSVHAFEDGVAGGDELVGGVAEADGAFEALGFG